MVVMTFRLLRVWREVRGGHEQRLLGALENVLDAPKVEFIDVRELHITGEINRKVSKDTAHRICKGWNHAFCNA